jgi:cytochrome c-type protein NapC
VSVQNLIALVVSGVVVLVLLLALTAGPLSGSYAGRLLLLCGLVLLPLLVSGTGTVMGVRRSSSTEFCLSCHTMEPYGKSLFVDNPQALAAVHYQRRLISREQTCFACHTDYALFGNVKAKMNGLRHVWVYYFGQVPERPALYQPYPNYNCLHCHDDARGYLESPDHRPLVAALASGERSCLSCHRVAHDPQAVGEGARFWVGE